MNTPDQRAVLWTAVCHESRYDAELQGCRKRAAELFAAVNTCSSSDSIADTIAGCLLELVARTRIACEQETAAHRVRVRLQANATAAGKLEKLANELRVSR
jgi:hypothetical protein